LAFAQGEEINETILTGGTLKIAISMKYTTA
jgi:hypothetical protein